MEEEIKEINEEEIIVEETQNTSNLETPKSSDLYPYQCLLFVFTQFGYLAVVPSMLSTTFFEPNEEFCQNNFNSSHSEENLSNSTNYFDEKLFYSLLIEWNQHCQKSIWTAWISTIVLFGTIFGSFAAGFMADRFGRKPVVVCSMFAICLFNFLLFMVGGISQLAAFFIFFFIGTACGGYMVTNMVLLVEFLRNPNARLLVVSLNGWPLGMIGTAFLAYFLCNWRFYCLAISLFALLFSIIIQYFACESIPWLIQSGKDRKAHYAQKHLIRINSFLALSKKAEQQNENSSNLFLPLNENGGIDSIKNDEKEEIVVYNYFDLFRHKTIRIRLLALLFCFGSSSIVSFGLYFSAELLPGLRYLNIALMGFCKLLFGFLPFIASNFVGRKPILLISIGFAMLSAWFLVFSQIFGLNQRFLITSFGLLMTGAVDPNWKIIHLFSIELFPTPIRNMARALCNVFARLGSLSGPWVILTKIGGNQFFPFLTFALLLTLQFFISLIFLPETKDKPLPDFLFKSSLNSQKHLKNNSSSPLSLNG
ncbi:unnamed protein product [Meloidogyne enterolobii]|uniref:Major facilitator superfamily (MFS) profile domain-containing protein n=2 Tax=Meloidogyne enterolobii TaxID=390850 RepID=A0A6V7XKT4_MELEN|nr:unnamed protein product [Meloidogyne enterolobii]